MVMQDHKVITYDLQQLYIHEVNYPTHITSGKKRICCVSFAAVFVYAAINRKMNLEKKKPIKCCGFLDARSKYLLNRSNAAVLCEPAANNSIKCCGLSYARSK